MIGRYSGIAPKADLVLLRKLGEKFKGKSFLHVNSTRAGGGVAEILQRMVPILMDLGIEARWEVIGADERFFDITKKFHNALQGKFEEFSDGMLQHHFEVNRINAATLDLEADAVLIHDPQPVALVEFRKNGKWIWRCHIDVADPIKEVWNHLVKYCSKYDAAVFSASKFARSMPIDEFIIAPSIDPLSDKNRDLSEDEIRETVERLQIPLDRPVILQVSRFDRFKDSIGVIKAYRVAKKYNDCILVLAGSAAADDPEGELVLSEVKELAADDPDIHVLLLPPFSDKDINALQRIATVVLQKSLKEGFGLTVSEAMWKGKAVIGGDTGGIPLQIIHGVNGFLVSSVEGAAFRIRQLLNNPEMARKMGESAKEYVRTNFLMTRQIRDYLSVWYSIENKGQSAFEL
jgi:trehalose synthase